MGPEFAALKCASGNARTPFRGAPATGRDTGSTRANAFHGTAGIACQKPTMIDQRGPVRPFVRLP
jgi:hypothetical protein